MIFLLASFAIFPVAPLLTHAHPGRTDSSGSHTCRTNCNRWGLGDSEYHHHGGGGSSAGSSRGTDTAPAVETHQTQTMVTMPTHTPLPTRIPTRIPTRRPTSRPTPAKTVAPLPTTGPSLTSSPTKTVRPVQVSAQAPKQPGFFAWLRSLFRGS